jgi:perosamine synthetase
MAAANVALHMGAKPIFAEVDPATWCLSAAGIERALTPQTRVVVPIQTYGNACDMDPINELCRSRNIVVVEDAAEAFGTRYKGRRTGSLADLSTFSFQAIKTITTGEGGMVLTHHEEWVEQLKLYRSHGLLHTRYLHEVAGLNFRLTNLQAAMGCAQLEQIDTIASARQRMNATYRHLLDGVEGITLQAFESTVDPMIWAIAVKLDPIFFPASRDKVVIQLSQAGIETRAGFHSANCMPHIYGGKHPTPICDEVSRQVISLPSYPQITGEEIARVCDTLVKCRNKA